MVIYIFHSLFKWKDLFGFNGTINVDRFCGYYLYLSIYISVCLSTYLPTHTSVSTVNKVQAKKALQINDFFLEVDINISFLAKNPLWGLVILLCFDFYTFFIKYIKKWCEILYELWAKQIIRFQALICHCRSL